MILSGNIAVRKLEPGAECEIVRIVALPYS